MPLDFFTTDDGDIVLRAGQGSYPVHDFRVHKFILSLVSPVFKDMFASPQPPDQNHNEQPDTSIIDISEPPYILDTILRLIYPGVELPKIPNVSTLNALLSMADKYNITSLYPVLRQSLKTFLPGNPFRVYIIACRFGFLEEAKQALRVLTPEATTLRPAHEKDLRHISSIDLYRLMWFIRTREREGRAKIRVSTLLIPGEYLNICEHWSDGEDFYDRLEGKLQNLFEENPCAQFDDLNGVLAKLPDPPLGCAPELQMTEDGEEIFCPLRPSSIRDCLTFLARALNEINDTLIESAFEKKF